MTELFCLSREVELLFITVHHFNKGDFGNRVDAYLKGIDQGCPNSVLEAGVLQSLDPT